MASDINGVNWENPDSVISYFEENQIQIINRNWGESKLDFENLRLCVHYINALYQKAHYSKCMDFIQKIQSLISDVHDEDLDDLKRQILFVRGMILNRTKKYKAAELIFVELQKLDPDHHYYSQWLSDSRSKQYNWLINVCFVSALVFYVFDLVFETQGIGLILTSVILFILGFALPRIFKRIIK